jgi:hypothetical protein
LLATIVILGAAIARLPLPLPGTAPGFLAEAVQELLGIETLARKTRKMPIAAVLTVLPA